MSGHTLGLQVWLYPRHVHLSEATAGIQKSDFAIFLQEWPPAHTHTHTLQPSGRGNSSRKAICCPPRCYGNCADTDSCAGELLSVMLEVRNQQCVIRISCYSLVLLITMQHWFIYISNTSVLCKAHLQMFFITLHLTSSNTYKGHIYKSAQATWLFFMWLHLVS